MDIAPIKTKRDYRQALKEIEGLMGAKRHTPEGDRLDVLVTLVGGSQPGGTAELSDSQWQSIYDRNLWPAVRASRHAAANLCLFAIAST